MYNNLIEKFSRIQIVVGLTIEFDGVEDFIFLDQSLCILDKQRLNLSVVVAVRKVNSCVPLVKLNARVDSLLHFVALKQTLHMTSSRRKYTGQLKKSTQLPVFKFVRSKPSLRNRGF